MVSMGFSITCGIPASVLVSLSYFSDAQSLLFEHIIAIWLLLLLFFFTFHGLVRGFGLSMFIAQSSQLDKDLCIMSLFDDGHLFWIH